MSHDFPAHYRELNERIGELGHEIGDTMAAFGQLHRAATADGALSTKIKELIALGIGIAVRCDGCIAYHVHDALAAGASRDEVTETIAVAVLMGGGPSVVYGAEAFEALAQFSTTGLETVVA